MTLRSISIVAAFAAIGSASAIILAPGGQIAGPGSLFSDTPTMLAQHVAIFGLGGNSINGRVHSAVMRNTLGTLDFYVQVYVGAGGVSDPVPGKVSDPIHRVTMFDFTGYTTDVGHRTDAYTSGAGGEVPFVANGNVQDFSNRNPSGSTVGFDYAQGDYLVAGQYSTTFVVRTNATTYTIGVVNVIDGDVDEVVGFKPTGTPVPEPATLAGLGMAALAVVRRRRRN